MKKPICILIAVIFIAAVFASCKKQPSAPGANPDTDSANDTDMEPQNDQNAQNGADTVKAAELYNETIKKYENNTHPVAVIVTNQEKVIAIELYEDIAPISVANFISLANSGYYDGIIFHRVIDGFMIQTGDPTGTGTGGPGYCIKGEFESNNIENNISHKKGVVSMARRPDSFDSAGSQFFICVADSDFLDGDYAAFGRVLEGQDVADAIAKVQTNANDKPLVEQSMVYVRAETFGATVPELETMPE